MSLLNEIVNTKRQEVARSKERLPLKILAEIAPEASAPRGFAKALTGKAPNIIAEVKRASPSRGVLGGDARLSWHPEVLAKHYEEGGARAVSVLTDGPFFWGSHDTLVACRAAISLPVLRKDFILDPYQIVESRWLGADAVLLIARVLEPSLMRELAAQAFELGMDVLLEVHADEELKTVMEIDGPGAIIGVNSRNLDTLEIDPERPARVAAHVGDRLLVAESGISTPEAIQTSVARGIGAFLIGEYLARHHHPAEALRLLRGVS